MCQRRKFFLSVRVLIKIEREFIGKNWEKSEENLKILRKNQ